MGRRSFKKKVLKQIKKVKKLGSIWDKYENEDFQNEAMFVPPELLGDVELIDNEGLELLKNMTEWDVATRYHEFKAKKSLEPIIKRIRDVSAAAVLRRAQELLGSLVHPTMSVHGAFDEIPYNANKVEIDLEATIDENPHLLKFIQTGNLMQKDLRFEWEIPRTQGVVLAVDTSLSMTGEKLALTAVALAVVLLQFPYDPIGIIAFENTAQIIKNPTERINVFEMVKRFLDVPAQGYTHLEDGLKAALKFENQIKYISMGVATVVLTDGKYTAGRDPEYLAPLFNSLMVLKMGNDRSSDSLCRELAHKGRGVMHEVESLKELPEEMYQLVKSLLRSRN